MNDVITSSARIIFIELGTPNYWRVLDLESLPTVQLTDQPP